MRKKPGPKKKPASEAKETTLQIRINQSEKDQFAKAAGLDNRPLSSWIRDRLLKLSRQEIDAGTALVKG